MCDLILILFTPIGFDFSLVHRISPGFFQECDSFRYTKAKARVKVAL